MTGQARRSRLYEGAVIHQRLRPVRHRFRYRVFSLMLDLGELDELAGELRLLGIERPGILGFRARDHGARDGSPLEPWALSQFAQGGQEGIRRIELLCFPRLWGYVFNPLSVYFGYDARDRLAAVLYEVSNTFGGQHVYVLPTDPARAASGGWLRHATAKTFYVSPFIDMEARYEFALKAPGERLDLVIRETDRNGLFFAASQTGRMRPLDDRNLALCTMRHPAMTLKVIGAIHLEALRLWLKGAPFHPRAAGGSGR